MNDSEFEKLSAKARRGRLTPDEAAEFRSHLVTHPAAQSAWEEEEALVQLVSQLPDVPMPSNFTARVLAAVEREARPVASPAREPWAAWLLAMTRSQRIALAAATACAGLLGYQQYRAHHRAQVAESLAKFTGAAELPGVEVLKDFDAIRRLSLLPPGVDAELVSALSQPNEK